MNRVLICTIMRDQRANVERWETQLAALVEKIKDEFCYSVSVVENDSTDGTAEWLRNKYDVGTIYSRILKSVFSYYLSTQTLGTQKYGSVWSLERIRNLAAARQKCLDQAGDLSRFSKIVYIEPDVSYDPSWCAELILAKHPKQAAIEPDIYSGWSLRSETHPKESIFLYDTCVSRQTQNDICWDFTEKGDTWRGHSLIRTDLGGVNSNCLHRVWSTFNCFCVYNAKPFIEGVRWDYINRRINPSGMPVEGGGYLDADTSVICELFRERGYSNVLLNTNCLIRHL